MGCLENQSLSLALRGKTTQAVRRCSLTTVLTVLNLVVVLLAQSEAPSLQFGGANTSLDNTASSVLYQFLVAFVSL